MKVRLVEERIAIKAGAGVMLGEGCGSVWRIGVGLAREACRWFPLSVVVHNFSYPSDIRFYQMDGYLKSQVTL